MSEQYFTSLNGYKIKDENAIRTYDTVASMKGDTKLKEGMHIKTKGYYSVNDGGQGEYNIVNDNTLVADNGSIHSLNNGLYAILIDNEVNVKKFGAHGNATNDDSTAFTKAINYCNTNKKNLILPEGKYLINSDLPLLNKGVSIIGNFSNNSVKSISDYKTQILDNRSSNNYLISYANEGDSGNSIYNIAFSNISENELKCVNYNYGGYKSNIENISFADYTSALTIDGTHAVNINNVNGVRCGSLSNNGNVYAFDFRNATDVIMTNCMIEHSRFMLYVYQCNSFVMDKCYFEIASKCGYTGNEPIIINGGTITNSSFTTRPVQTIATRCSLDNLDDVYYMVYLLSTSVLNNCTFHIGGDNDGTTDTNKSQAKYLKVNESGTLIANNNYFNRCAFDTPSMDLHGRSSNFSNNIVSILLQESTDSTYTSKYAILNYDRMLSNNNLYTIMTTKTSSRQHEYYPSLARYNYIDYGIKSFYNTTSGFDFTSYNFPQRFSKTPTLTIQGESGMFELYIRNSQASGIYYKASFVYNISGEAETVTLINETTNRLASNGINFYKKSGKLVIQLTGTSSSYDFILKANELNRGTFAFVSDVDALADTPIYSLPQ